jgi:hypothetical protein
MSPKKVTCLLKKIFTCFLTPINLTSAPFYYSSLPYHARNYGWPPNCSRCTNTLPLSSFLADPSNPKSKTRMTCIKCPTENPGARGRMKRKALESLDSNVPSKRPAITRSKPTESPPIPLPYIQSETRLEPPPPIHPADFLPADQWKLVQDFYTALDDVKMEYCARCRERWFSMGLRNEICDACYLRDKGSQSPFLMSTDNNMVNKFNRIVINSMKSIEYSIT